VAKNLSFQYDIKKARRWTRSYLGHIQLYFFEPIQKLCAYPFKKPGKGGNNMESNSVAGV
jgi:hypothetical protein